MKKFLKRTTSSITDCETHLKSTNSNQTPIESYLTQYLLILLHAEIEMAIQEILVEKASKSTDKQIESFLKNTGKKSLKSARKGGIADFLKLFSDEAKTYLNNKIEEAEAQKYTNAIENRHTVAHTLRGVQVSFDELKEIAKIANKILNIVRESLDCVQDKESK